MKVRSAAAAVLTAASLSACATGLNAGTYQQNTRQDTAYADLEGVSLRNLHVKAPSTSDGIIPAGGEAVVTGVLVNSTDTADRLRSVASDLAADVTLTADGAPATGIEVAPGGTTTAWTAVLSGLREQVRPGEFITVTLTFATAGRKTVQVPVQTGDNGLEDREVVRDPYELHHPGGEDEGSDSEQTGDAHG